MINNPTSLSEMLKSIVTGYDEIKYLSEQNALINNNISSIKTAFESELQTSKAYNERTKLNLDDINEKLANAKVFFDEIASNQAEVKALFTSINNLVIKEAALIKNVDAKILNYTELNAKNTELLAEINTIKEAVILATKTYKNDCDLALKELNESLARANALNESLASKQIELNNTLESIETARTNCLQIANEIKEMRKRSQCLMSKAEEIFNKATWFENTLNEYIAKITELENNYNLAFAKNEELELKIKTSITTLDKILIALNGRSLDEVLNELKTTNNTLQTAINTKAEIDTIKANLEAILTEQNAKLDNYYTKLQCDELLSLANDEIAKLQTNKADKLELEPINQALSDLATADSKIESDMRRIDSRFITTLENNTKILRDEMSHRAMASDVYTKLESDEFLGVKADKLELEPIKTDITNLSNDKANKIDVYHKSDVYTKLESDNLLKTKANNTDLAKAKSDLEVRIKAVEDDYVKVYDTPINVSVGAGGTYAKLSDAFKALRHYKKTQPNLGNCTITMLPNFVLNERFTFDFCDMSHITLTSNNAEIVCNFTFDPIKYIFEFHHSKSINFQSCKFKSINKPQYFLLAHINSTIRVNACSFDNFYPVIRAYGSSSCDVRNSSFSNITGDTCLYAGENSKISSLSNTFDTMSRAFISIRNSTTHSFRDIFKNIKTECFLVDWGGFAMYEAHPNGSFVNSPKKCNLEPNTLYKHGIFFDRTTNEGALIQKDVPYGKLFELNGLKILILRNVPIVPVVGADRYQNHLNMGHYEVFYSFTLPISGFFLVGASYKGAFCSGQTLNNFHRIYRNRDAQRDMHTVPAVGQPFEREKLNFNFIAIGL